MVNLTDGCRIMRLLLNFLILIFAILITGVLVVVLTQDNASILFQLKWMSPAIVATITSFITLNMRLNKQDNKDFFQEYQDRNKQEHSELGASLISFEQSISDIITKLDTVEKNIGEYMVKWDRVAIRKERRNAYEANANQIVEATIPMVLTYDQTVVKDAILAKAIAFIELVIDIQSTLEDEQLQKTAISDIINNKFLEKSNAVRLKMELQLGKDFTNLFYQYHADAVNRFVNQVSEALQDTINDRIHRIQDASLVFMRDFISQYNKCVTDNKEVLLRGVDAQRK